MRWAGPLESAGLLTVLPVPARAAASVRGVLPWAPLVGLALGGIATGVAVLGSAAVSPAAGAALALAALAALTRGLHLDGLADTADGLGPLRGRARALEVMRQGDVGPFGVVTVVLTLLVQAACMTALLGIDGGWLGIWSAVVTGRLVLTRAGLPGTPPAGGSSLGRAVVGTVPPAASAAWVVVVLALLIAASWPDPSGAVRLAGAVAAGVVAAEVVLRRAVARLGGITGDVMGAMVESATAATLLVAAAVL